MKGSTGRLVVTHFGDWGYYVMCILVPREGPGLVRISFRGRPVAGFADVIWWHSS